MNDVPEKRSYKVGWVTCGLVAVVLIVSGVILAFTLSGNSTNQSVADQGKRRDCVTILNNARRAVFDDVDIYKAILIRGATDRQLGLPPQGDVAFFRQIDERLGVALKEATRIRPPEFANGLIEHGGVVAGVSYPPCPG